jgi:hypothetical protein
VGIAVSIYAIRSYVACIFSEIMITEYFLIVMMHTSRLMEDLSVQPLIWTLEISKCCIKFSAGFSLAGLHTRIHA